MKASLWFLVMPLAAFLGSPSYAFDLTGAWSTSADACPNVFAKTGTTITFKQDAELNGGGFIVEGNNIHGPAFKCSIKARKEDSAVTHLLATCSTQIMIDQMQVSYKVQDDNTIVRFFPGLDSLGQTFSRCQLK